MAETWIVIEVPGSPGGKEDDTRKEDACVAAILLYPPAVRPGEDTSNELEEAVNEVWAHHIVSVESSASLLPGPQASS